MKRYAGILAGLLLLVSLAAGGCSGGDSAANVEIPPLRQEQKAAREKIEVDVYWDATYSMKGYATIAGNNFYRTLPDELEDLGNSLGTTKFFRFGQEVKPLEGREHRRFSDPAYYDEVITAIHTVIGAANNEHLSVVVTDLFESDADWNNVAKQIKDKYFSQHKAMALIGIKNPFNGDIFDAGYGDHSKQAYDSGGDEKRYRPFYMMVLGSDAEVQVFLKRFKSRHAESESIHYLQLSENIVDQAQDLSTMKIKSSKNLFNDEKLKLTDKKMKEFGIDSGDEKSILTVGFSYKLREDSCKVDTKKLKPVAVVKYLEDNEWKDLEGAGDVQLKLDSDPDNPEGFLLTTTFTADKTLKKKAINLLSVDVVPARDGFSLPDWVKNWNISNADVTAAEQIDGSKTINFVHLVESLKNSALDAAEPYLANETLVIRY